MNLWRRATFRYLCYGALFGALFPLSATALDMWLHELAFSPAAAAAVQAAQPLHWMIDTAPLFLGLFAALAGRRQEYVEQALSRAQSAEEIARLSAENARLYADMRQQFEEVQRLYTAAEESAQMIRALSAPLLPIGATMLVLPLIGAFDRERMADMRASLLKGVQARRARIVIVDCTGLADLTEEALPELAATFDALALLGATPLLCGVRAAIAPRLVAARFGQRSLRIAPDLATGIELGRELAGRADYAQTS